MVDLSNIKNIPQNSFMERDDFSSNVVNKFNNDYDINKSIFGNYAKDGADSTNSQELEALYAELKEVEDKQGLLSQGFNGIKEITNIGTSSEKCNATIEKYKSGEITFEEALAEIDKFEGKQESGLNLFANIATSFAAIGAATLGAAAIIASGGTATPLVVAAIGAGAGAVTKASIKTIDRATNKVEGDALDSKEIAKDALSGAVTGAVAAATMGTGAAQSTLKESVKAGIKGSAKTGFVTGGITGASNYTIDCAFEDDKQFNVKDFAVNTAVNSAVGGTVGTIVGGTNGALRFNNLITHGGKAVVNGQIANASSKDIVANSVCSSTHKILNKTIKDIAA